MFKFVIAENSFKWWIQEIINEVTFHMSIFKISAWKVSPRITIKAVWATKIEMFHLTVSFSNLSTNEFSLHRKQK
jgi:hypothetical protein